MGLDGLRLETSGHQNGVGTTAGAKIVGLIEGRRKRPTRNCSRTLAELWGEVWSLG
jgi:hypothetical protein